LGKAFRQNPGCGFVLFITLFGMHVGISYMWV
jgi:hypothetical protein